MKKLRRRMVLERCFFCIVIAALAFLYVNEKLHATSQNTIPVEQIVVEMEDGVSGEKDTVKGKEEAVAVDYVTKWALEKVDKPETRNYEQVMDKLYELAEENLLIEEILEHPGRYPDNLLEALANNPEMADFVKDWPRLAGTVTGGLTENEKEQEFPLFLQWDPRWGYASYGDDSSIAVSGCGPASLSMALYYLTKDESLTPDRLASYSMENGYYVSGTGTAWALITDVPLLYGINVTQPAIEEYEMMRELDKGNILIASMRPGDFTAGGHFLVIYGYDRDVFLINDPNCIARSREKWSFEEIGHQIKNLWSLGKEWKNW